MWTGALNAIPGIPLAEGGGQGREGRHARGDGVGTEGAYPEIEPILKNFGKLFFTGEKPGLAQTAKLANNLLAAAALVVSSEAMAMGVKAGLDPKILLDIINAGSGRNSATQDKFPRSVLPGTFDFGFATGLSYKDVRLCVDEAEALGVRWSWARPCARCSPSRRRNSARTRTSRASRRCSRNGRG